VAERALPGGELERAVLVSLWELDAATVPRVYERVGKPQGLAYTTVATILDRLHRKRLVSRKRVGKGFIYRARARRRTVERAELTQALARLTGWDAEPAMASLVEAVESIDPNLLEDLSRAVEERRRRRK
jgi:predicted transcriptional regulator